MQIIFDSRFDGVADAHRMRDMLTAYINSRESVVTNVVNVSGSVDKRTEAQIGQAAKSAVERTLSVIPGPQGLPASTSEMPATPAFTPGTVSGSVPSDAGAAQVPTAPEASPAGVPPPPTVASVPAPPVAAPEAPAAPSTSAPSAEGLDSTGLPWDKRIHSSSKAKNADGSWRKLRGLNDAALVSRVEAELRSQGVQALAAGGYVAPPPQMPAGGVVPTPPQVPPPPGTDAPAAPPAPSGPDVTTPEGLMEWVTPRMMDGRLTFDTVAAALQANGVESLAALKTNPAAVPGVYAALGGT